jgi:carotenoid cleavage dioxygenase
MPPSAEPTLTDLAIEGTLPAELSGQLMGIGPDFDGTKTLRIDANDAVVHSVHVHAGRAMSYRRGHVLTGPDVVASNIVAFGGSILALGDGSLAYELTPDLHALRRVDLAGQSRGVAAYPKRDPLTGALHIVAASDTGAQAHVVVSSGALTRMSRSIDAPGRIRDLAITRDRVVFVADGFAGVTPRDGEAHVTWMTTRVAAPYLIHAHDVGERVIVYAITTALERWTLHAASAVVDREVLDPTPRQFAHTNDSRVGEPPGCLWTTSDLTADKYDLPTSTRVRHTFRTDCQPGDLVFVADDARRGDADGGWLVGFVHHGSGDGTDLVVLDAADIAGPAIATVRIPRRVPRGLRCTWIPSTDG